MDANGFEIEQRKTECDNCGGTGIVEVPSMLGYGTEAYPCTRCHALGKDEAAQVDADRRAWIHSAIR